MEAINADPKNSSPENDCAEKAPRIEKETRFAVVMYGGISLAIYIHGVAQELYHMVRATARRVDNDECYLLGSNELSSSEKVYRCLGEALKTKFVVDILSGTSAGGINAVFLAKALVNDRSMEMIKDFWIQQGDIGLLVNDKQSLTGLSGLTLQNPPLGLLNSQRFYYKLLEALMKMGSSDPDIQSPYVEELDLNITTTDIRGLDLPIQISNTTVNELRYKNVFKFYYKQKPNRAPGNDRNDFSRKIDPFLAFAARCTASIPPAFEAMQLKDIDPILKTAMFKTDYGNMTDNETSWKPFYEDYLNSGDDFALRSFGDGGYLDNKPFSYATEALLRRRADFPVDRRLIYIEPSPEHPENRPLSTERPDMVQNILAALVGLPRQETIREDLKVIQDRNKIIHKIKGVLAESSYHTPESIRKPPTWVHSPAWANKYLMEPDFLKWYGSGYIAYHQLRMETIVSNLSAALGRVIGWNEGGPEVEKLDNLFHAWLDQKYSIFKPTGRDKKYSQNDILFRLDLSFRMRKINFLQFIMNIILLHIGEYMQQNAKGTELESIFDASHTTFALKGNVDDECVDQSLKLLGGLKRELNNIYNYMRGRGRALRARGMLAQPDANSELADLTIALEKLKDYLEHPLEAQDGTNLVEEASVALATHYAPGKKAKPGGFLYTTFQEVSDRSQALGIARERQKDGKLGLNLVKTQAQLMEKSGADYIDRKNIPACLKVYQQVQKCLAFYYDNFEYYDMLTFPIQYGTEASESDIVEIIRVSPEDATLIVDEKKTGKYKLAGTKLANFGAFFNSEWRQNDMLWGRLDAAEILLNELLDKGHAENYTANLELLRKTIGKDCQTATCPYDMVFEEILKQDLRPRDKTILYKFLEEDLTPRGNPKTDELKGVNFNQLNNLLKKDQELARVAADIRQAAGQSLDRLMSDLTQSLGTKPNLDPNTFKDKLRHELAEIQKARTVVSRQIEAEKKKLEAPLTTLAAKGETSQVTLFEQEQKFIEAFPEKTRGRFSNLLARFARKDRSRYEDILRSVVKDEKLLDYFKNGYEVNTDFEVESTVKLADRGAKVLNRLLDGLSQKYPIRKPVGIFATVLQIVSTFITFSLPKTLGNFLFENYWVGIAFISEVILLVAGYFARNDAVKNIGQVSLLVTLVVYLVVVLLNRWIARRKNGLLVWAGRTLKWLFITLLVLLVITVFYLGLVYLGMLPPLSGPVGILVDKIHSLFMKPISGHHF